ncbi:MAG TPA: hypothetical protein VFV17_02795 [Usitatibacteraceae bacterium]|nr:hypothetical protein [Usitatibacteraceae bacterium]
MKTPSKLLIGSLFAALISFAQPALADLNAEDISRFVKMCDSNKDGMISKDEVMKRAAMAFDKMDTAKKGMADDKKTIAFLAELSKTDGSNGTMVSRADFMKRIEGAWAKADTAKKGMIDSKQAMLFLQELMRSGS